MTSKESGIVDAIDWQLWIPSPPAAGERREGSWRWVILAIVVLVHALGGLFASLRETRRQAQAPPEDALVVNFIDRAPEQRHTKQPADRPTRVPTSLPRSSSRPKGKSGVPLRSSTGEDSPLLLHIQPDTWNPDSFAFSRSALDQPAAAIPAPKTFMPGIRFHSSSPKQKLEMLGALFGSIKYDPCLPTRMRLANLHTAMNELDLAADLRTRERHCRP